jgi:cellulose synthase/poly-beta-1,6-N-acetylglucosamine synthase-like glycosyltransferase
VIDAAVSAAARVFAGYAVFTALGGLALALSAAWLVLRHGRELSVAARDSAFAGRTVPPVSVVLTATDQDADIGERLDALAALDYPAFEIVVVSNGPIAPDLARALARLQSQAVDLIYRPLIKTGRVTGCYHSPIASNLVVIEKERGTIADALNAGINAARSPYVCLVEPRTWLDRSSLSRLMGPVVEDPERVAVTAGIARVMNGSAMRDGDVAVGRCPSHPAVSWSVLAGLRGALFAAGASPLLGAGVAPRGAVLVHRKEALRAGGVPPDGTADDLASVPWTRAGLRSAFVPLPVAWTVAPATFAGLAAAHRFRAAAAFGALWALRSWDHCRQAHGVVRHAARVVRHGWTLGAPLDLVALIVVTAGFGLGVTDFSVLLAVWVSVLVGRTAVSSAAILVHDVTPKRYPSSWDVTRLFLAVVFDLTVGRLLALWWTLSAMPRRRRIRPPTVATPATATAHPSG